MKTLIKTLLVLTFLAGLISQNAIGQEKRKEENNNPRTMKATFEHNKVIQNDQTDHLSPENTENIKLPETPIIGFGPLAIRTASISGNWSNTATWDGLSIPIAGDAVIINSGITVTVDIAAYCQTLTINAGSNSNYGISISGTNSLTVSALVTMNNPTYALFSTRFNFINVNAGTASFGSFTMLGSSANQYNRLTISTGSCSVGALIITNANDQIALSNAGTINFTSTISGNPTLTTVIGSTVNYTSGSSQTILAKTYNGNLGLSGAGTKTIAASTTVTVNGNITNSSTLVLTAGTSTTSTWLVMGGNVTNTGTITSTGAYTRFIFNSANAQTFTNNGTMTSPVSSFDVSNTNALGLTLSGSNNIVVTRANLFKGIVHSSNKLTLGAGGTTYAVVQRGVAANTSPAGSFDVVPVFNVGSGGLNLLYDNGSVAYSTGFEVPNTNTCMIFYIFDAADVTLNTNLIITEELNFYGGTGSPKLRIGAHSLTLGGTVTYTVAGAFYGGATSNLILDGSTTVNAIINGLNNFTLNNSGGVTLGGAVTVNGILTLSNGLLNNGANLTMANGSTISRTATGTLSAAPTFSGTVNLLYTGGSPIATGKEMPANSSTLNNLTTNTGGVTQSGIPSGGTVSTIYTQGFNSAPADWTTEIVSNPAGITPALTYVTSAVSTYPTVTFTEGGVGVQFNSYDCESGDQIRLKKIASPISTVGTSNITVVFDWYMYTGTYSGADQVTVQYSTNGTTWNSSSSYPRTGTNGWVTNSCVLPSGAENQAILYIAFLFTSGYGYNCHLDNMKLNVTTPGTPIPSAYTINGTLNLAGNYIIGSNTLTMANGSTINRSDGTLSAAPTFGTNVNLIYSGSNAITTGFENPGTGTIINNFTVTNSSATGVTLDKNTDVNNILTLTSGLLTIGANTLQINGTLSIASPSVSKMIVLDDGTSFGTLLLKTPSLGAKSIPIGDTRGSADFSPVVVDLLTGTTLDASSYLSFTMQALKDPANLSAVSYLTRSWTLTPINISTPSYIVQLNYVDGDIQGSENNIWIGKINGGVWTLLTQPNFSNNKFTSETLTSFSTFTGGEEGALPVTLSSFSSSFKERNVNLIWTTEKEINNSGFDVERAEVKNQNSEYRKIGYIQGKGTANVPTSYSFEDKKLNSGKYNYRLKQIDNNGNFEYHNLANIVEIGIPTKFNLSQNYPNPFNPTSKIDFDLPFDSKVNIIFYDMTGREVKTLVNDTRTAGFYTVQFNAADLASGTYFYRIMTKSAVADYVMTKKMILVK